MIGAAGHEVGSAASFETVAATCAEREAMAALGEMAGHALAETRRRSGDHDRLGHSLTPDVERGQAPFSHPKKGPDPFLCRRFSDDGRR
jgi:hypothetical protein